MRDAVEHAFGPLVYEDADDGRRQLEAGARTPLRDLIRISADELVELDTAAAEVERSGLHERAALLRDLAGKLRALAGEAETAPHRAGPGSAHDGRGARDAARTAPPDRARPAHDPARGHQGGPRTVSFRYLSRMTGRKSRQHVQPHGILYGSRAYLVGRSDWTEDMRYWVLANMSEAAFTEESFGFDEDFDLEEFAGRSFGVVPGGADRRRVAFHPRRPRRTRPPSCSTRDRK